jgi:hypothetical protein
MEGFEFFPEGCKFVHEKTDESSSFIVHYKDLDQILIQTFTEEGNTKHRLYINQRCRDEILLWYEDGDRAKSIRDTILADFLASKRRPPPPSYPPKLDRVVDFLETLEFVPGVPDGESEAAVERCKKRARGEGEEKE